MKAKRDSKASRNKAALKRSESKTTNNQAKQRESNPRELLYVRPASHYSAKELQRIGRSYVELLAQRTVSAKLSPLPTGATLSGARWKRALDALAEINSAATASVRLSQDGIGCCTDASGHYFIAIENMGKVTCRLCDVLSVLLNDATRFGCFENEFALPTAEADHGR